MRALVYEKGIKIFSPVPRSDVTDHLVHISLLEHLPSAFANQIVQLPEKMNVKSHKNINCEITGKILKISCVKCISLKFDIHFLGHS